MQTFYARSWHPAGCDGGCGGDSIGTYLTMSAVYSPGHPVQKVKLEALERWAQQASVLEAENGRLSSLLADATRQRFRAWLRENFDHLLLELRWAAQKGAERGIEQVLTLASDPAYYQTATKRRRRLAHAKDEEERGRAALLEEREAREAETRQLIQEGKLVPLTAWKLRDVTPPTPPE
jgi:hypothetical protein